MHYTEPVWLVGPPSAGFQADRPVPPEAVLAETLILPVGEASLGWLLARAHGGPPRCALHAESLGTIRALVARGLGCALLPYAAVAEDLATRRLAGAPVAGLTLTRRLATGRGRRMGRAVAVVAEAIGVEVAALLAAGAIAGARGG